MPPSEGLKLAQCITGEGDMKRTQVLKLPPQMWSQRSFSQASSSCTWSDSAASAATDGSCFGGELALATGGGGVVGVAAGGVAAAGAGVGAGSGAGAEAGAGDAISDLGRFLARSDEGAIISR